MFILLCLSVYHLGRAGDCFREVAFIKPEPVQINDLAELRQYVHQTLCDQNELEIGAFQMTERQLLRSQRPCGRYFCLHGPRSVRFVAIWDSERNSVLFYDATGERREQTPLSSAAALVAVG